MEHPHLLLSVVPVYLTSFNDSDYIRLYVGARLNSEWVRMWEETAAVSYKYQKNRKLYPSFSRPTLELCQGCIR